MFELFYFYTVNIQHTYIFTNIKKYTFTPIKVLSDFHNLDEIRQLWVKYVTK